jgi:hypothetical protein
MTPSPSKASNLARFSFFSRSYSACFSSSSSYCALEASRQVGENFDHQICCLVYIMPLSMLLGLKSAHRPIYGLLATYYPAG